MGSEGDRVANSGGEVLHRIFNEDDVGDSEPQLGAGEAKKQGEVEKKKILSQGAVNQNVKNLPTVESVWVDLGIMSKEER